MRPQRVIEINSAGDIFKCIYEGEGCLRKETSKFSLTGEECAFVDRVFDVRLKEGGRGWKVIGSSWPHESEDSSMDGIHIERICQGDPSDDMFFNILEGVAIGAEVDLLDCEELSKPDRKVVRFSFDVLDGDGPNPMTSFQILNLKHRIMEGIRHACTHRGF